MGDDCRHRWFFPIALAQLSPVRHSKLSGAKQQISSCCALSKVTEFLQNRKIWGEMAALWLHTACVMTSDVCSKKLWSIGFGVDCWRALRCACKYGLTAYQVKLSLARTRKLAFPCASLSLEGSCISFPFLGEEDGEGCEREKWIHSFSSGKLLPLLLVAYYFVLLPKVQRELSVQSNAGREMRCLDTRAWQVITD